MRKEAADWTNCPTKWADVVKALQPEPLSRDQQEWLEQNGRIEPGREQIVAETLEQAAKWCETKIPETGRSSFLAADIRAMSPDPNYRQNLVSETLARITEKHWPVDVSVTPAMSRGECSCGGAIADGVTPYEDIWREHILSLGDSPNYVALKVAEAELRGHDQCCPTCGVRSAPCKIAKDLERRVLELGGAL